MKEKTLVCVGIVLILAVLCSCAAFYSVNDYSPLPANEGVSVIPLSAGAHALSPGAQSIPGTQDHPAAQGVLSPHPGY